LSQPRSAAPQQSKMVLVSFSGIDGAGKSTQIANLCSFLGVAGLRVRIVAFWDDVAVFRSQRESAGRTIFRGDQGVGTPETPISRRDKNVRSPLMTPVRFGLYWLDALSLARRARRARTWDADVVIFDRYIYDELANLNLRSSLSRAFVRAVMRIAPRPNLSFILDADPEQAHRRKPEYPPDFVHANRMAYLRLAEFAGEITVVPPLPLDQAKNVVVRHVLSQFLSAKAENSGGEGSAPEAFPFPEKQMDGQSTRPLAS
jgi:thymidylate kinase